MQLRSKTRVSPKLKHTLLAFAVANALNITQASAATILVNYPLDDSGEGGGIPIPLLCSLREAVTSINTGSLQPGCSNTNGEPFGTNDRIYSGEAGTFVLNSSTVEADNRLTLTKDVTIDLAGSTVDADNRSGVFHVENSNVTLNEMTITGASGALGAVYAGGASLTINNSTISNNLITGVYSKGIIDTPAGLSVSNSTISGNEGKGLASLGFTGDANTISNSTISNNTYANILMSTGSVNISNSIISDAKPLTGFPGMYDCLINVSNTLQIENSIIKDGSCNAKQIGVLVVDPKLEPLADNGGLTQTHAIPLGSPARNAGNDNCLGTDQRGQARPASSCDIGAYEFGQVEIAVDSHRDDGTGCTLREAIESDTVNGCTATQPLPLFVDGTRVSFSPNLQSSVITLNRRQLSLENANVEIDASTRNGITINGNQQSPVLNIINSELMINGLTITGGKAEVVGGGGLYANVSRVYIKDSVFKDNMSYSNGGGLVFLDAFAVIENSTIANNTSWQNGGGIRDLANSQLTLLNTTVSGNVSLASGGGVDARGELFLRHATIAENSATQSGSALFLGGSGLGSSGRLVARNSIIAGTTGAPDCEGSEADNIDAGPGTGTIVQDGSCGGLAIDPKLLPLADNGGRTPTHALAEDSPARKMGLLSECTEKDQRGFSRTAQDGLCDVGAFEFQNSDMPVNFYVIPISGGKSVVIPL